ncbi:MAG: long-chain fatty acid--CoA ligase [Chloroflexi bacterium]|nr:long-chain fatty acid--CoA ligase [Chloroflexota bacterium]
MTTDTISGLGTTSGRPSRDDPARGEPLDFEAIPLHELLTRSAAASPRSPALVFYGRSTSYASLLRDVQRFASGLLGLGLHKGDRVGIMLPNCPQAVIAYYGVLWAGGTVVMINPLYTSRELRAQVEDSGARIVIALDQFSDRLEEIREDAGLEQVVLTGIQERLPRHLRVLFTLKQWRKGRRAKPEHHVGVERFSKLLASEPLERAVPVDPMVDLAVLQYTGGTTGAPKGAMLTHANLVANCQQIRLLYPGVGDSPMTIMGALPVFHAYGMTVVMNYGIMTGGRILLFPRFELKPILKAIQKYRPQLFPGVPTMYVAIANHSQIERFNLRSVEWCISGAAALPEQVKKSFEQLTGGRLVEGYGLSEASPVTHCNPLEGAQRPGSIGLPVAGTECRIVDLESGLPVAPGEAGELLVKGPQVMRGYWNRPDETPAPVTDGWLRTGDVARMDEDGFFYIVDRKKEIIIVAGHNVYPREVEEVLSSHLAVQEASVIGIPDPYSGEAVKAFVVLKESEGASREDLMGWCRHELAPYKIPRKIEFIDELPKSLIGKVLRRVLVEREEAARAAEAEGKDTGIHEATAPRR